MSSELRWVAIGLAILCAVSLLLIPTTEGTVAELSFLFGLAAVTGGLAARAWLQDRAHPDNEGRLEFLSWGASWPFLVGLLLPFMCLMTLWASMGLEYLATGSEEPQAAMALVVGSGLCLLAGLGLFLIRRIVVVDLNQRTVESFWGLRVLRRTWPLKDFHRVEVNEYKIRTKRGSYKRWKVQLIGLRVTLTLSSSLGSPDAAERLAKELSA
jgi:hypothetical protein